MSPNAPENSFLSQPHRIEGTPKEAKESFYELAKSKVNIVGTEEHIKLGREIFGEEFEQTYSPAIFVIGDQTISSEDSLQIEKWIHAILISVDRDRFVVDGEDYQDVIPYVLEHEIYEAWLSAKKGNIPKSEHIKHLLARRKEYMMAAKDGKLERIAEYHRKVAAQQVLKEIEDAYSYAKKRIDAEKSK